MFYQIMVQFKHVKPFLRCNEDIAPATKAKFLGFLGENSKLKMELAIVIDYGESFVKATYDLYIIQQLFIYLFDYCVDLL